LLGDPDLFVHLRHLHVPHVRILLELEVLFLERNGVVDPELRCLPENLWEGVLGEVPGERIRDVSEHEADFVGQGVGQDVGQNGEHEWQTASTARDGAIGDEKNSSDGFDVILDLCRNTRFVELILFKTPGVGKSRGVDDANLGKRLRTFSRFQMLALTTTPFLLVSS
jgi:hypothetical protein